MPTDNLPSVIANDPCCGLSHRCLFKTADRTGAGVGARTHDIEVYPRFANGYIALAPDFMGLVTPGNWDPDEKAHYTQTSTVNTFTLTGVADGATITLVTTSQAGNNSLTLTSVVGNTITIDLDTSAGVITTTWSALATFMNAQPTVAAIVAAAAAGADVGTLLMTAATRKAYPGDQTKKSSYTLTHGSDSLVLESVSAGAIITVNLAGGNNQALAVSSVSGNTINIQLETNGSGVSLSTIDEVVALINGHVGASAIAVASAVGATTDATLVTVTDDFVTAFPWAPRTKALTIQIQDDAFTNISPALGATITGSVTLNESEPTAAVFTLSPPDLDLVDASGRIDVAELIAVARAAVPDLTKVLLHVTDAASPSGYQLNYLGWEWHAG